MMDADGIRHRLASTTVLATFLKTPRAEIVTTLARCGVELLVLDMEHAEVSESDAREVLLAARLHGVPVVVRVDGPDRGRINRLLELGAAGIQMPRVASAEDVEAFVDLCRYPPAGTRSVSTAQAIAKYGGVSLTNLLSRRSARPLLVAQIETAVVDESLWGALGCVDVAFLGTTDLSVTAGTPGDLTSVLPLIQRVEAAASDHLHLGVFTNRAGIGEYAERGYRMLVIGSDLEALSAGAMALRADFDEATTVGIPSDQT